MSDPFDNVNLLGIILEGETDEDSPTSEELLSQLRENWEVLMMLAFYTGDSGTATSDPPDDSTGVLTDTAASFDTDEHNGRSLVIIDGLAAGNIYTIDDTTSTTLVCTGDNLYSDGVRSGDKYKVFYNLKNTSAHSHDGVDSKQVTQSKGRTLVACEGDELTHGQASWYTVRSFNIYIPTNAETIRAFLQLRSSNASGVGYFRLKITDNGSTVFYSDTAVQSGDTWSDEEISDDLSGADAGVAFLEFQSYTSNVIYDVESRAHVVIWDT